MKILMFRNRWVEPIQAGTKVQTVRPKRKRPIIVGDPLSLRRWLGAAYRSKQEIIAERRCTSVYPVRITAEEIFVSGTAGSPKAAGAFAARDGFETFSDMVAFFEEMHGLPFEGHVIAWD